MGGPINRIGQKKSRKEDRQLDRIVACSSCLPSTHQWAKLNGLLSPDQDAPRLSRREAFHVQSASARAAPHPFWRRSGKCWHSLLLPVLPQLQLLPQLASCSSWSCFSNALSLAQALDPCRRLRLQLWRICALDFVFIMIILTASVKANTAAAAGAARAGSGLWAAWDAAPASGKWRSVKCNFHMPDSELPRPAARLVLPQPRANSKVKCNKTKEAEAELAQWGRSRSRSRSRGSGNSVTAMSTVLSFPTLRASSSSSCNCDNASRRLTVKRVCAPRPKTFATRPS